MALLRLEEAEEAEKRAADDGDEVVDEGEDRDWRKDTPAFSNERQTQRALALSHFRG